MAQHKPGFMEKIKEKLPGHHHIPDVSGEETEETVPRVSHQTDSSETPVTVSTPQVEKKSIMQKIKEMLSGNHGKETSGSNNVYDTPAPKDNSEPGAKNLSVDDNNRGGNGQKAAEEGIRPSMARNKSI
jgi:hypothetical protein